VSRKWRNWCQNEVDEEIKGATLNKPLRKDDIIRMNVGDELNKFF